MTATVSDLIGRVEGLGRPRITVIGDLILDRYVWGDAERISQEAPVPLLRADYREHRLGGASSVATMLAALGAEVRLIGVVGRDTEAELVRTILDDLDINHDLVLGIDGRPTTLKERYIGRAQDRHPQQMIRVDWEVRDPIPESAQAELLERLPDALDGSDIVLISDYDKGVCTPSMLRRLIDACKQRGLITLADPIRSRDYSRYLGVDCMTPNRLEASMATGTSIKTPEDGIRVGHQLLRELNMKAALVTLDRDGMALARADGTGVIVPTRPRQVYDITGAGDMVLSVVGLVLASGGDYQEAAALGNVAGGLEVEKIGVALITRQEILRDLHQHRRGDTSKIMGLETLLEEVRRRRAAGQSIVFTNGCFDLLHIGHTRLLNECADQGDYLIVALNSDASVRRLKGPERPITPQDNRAEIIAALECVDAVTLFEEDTPLRLIEAIKPEILAKGGDYTPETVVGRDFVEANGGRVVLIPLIQGQSTTGIVKKIGARPEQQPAGS